MKRGIVLHEDVAPYLFLTYKLRFFILYGYYSLMSMHNLTPCK